MFTNAQTAAFTGSFAPMPVHVGKVLRELYLSTGLKMERFRDAVTFSNKTIYYHFGQEDLNTAILRRYEAGLKKLGKDIDIWQILAEKSRDESGAASGNGNASADYEAALHGQHVPSVTAEPEAEPYGDENTVAELLRKAADLLDKQKQERQSEGH